MNILDFFRSLTRPENETTGAATNTDVKQSQAFIDALHWREQLDRYEALRETINAELRAIYKTRAQRARLSTLADDPTAFVELAYTIEHRDTSERREAALQRQLITLSNQIYTTKKKIAAAERAAGI